MNPGQQLQRILADVPTYQSDMILSMLPFVAALQGALHTRMLALQHEAAQPDPRFIYETDYLLNTQETAKRLAVSTKWIRENIDTLPFSIQMGRLHRFSVRGMEEWIAEQRGGN